MMILTKRNTYIIGLIITCLAAVAIFFPDSSQKESRGHALKVSSTPLFREGDNNPHHQPNSRRLTGHAHVDISEFHHRELVCPNPEESIETFHWDEVGIDGHAPNPQEYTSGGVTLRFSRLHFGHSELYGYHMHGEEYGYEHPRMGIRKIIAVDEVIASGDENNAPKFPADYVTMEIEFSVPTHGVSVSNGDIHSGSSTSVVRIRMIDDDGKDIPLDLAVTSPEMKLVEDYAWMNRDHVKSIPPGFEHSLYARPRDSTIAVRKISLDLGVLSFETQSVGKYSNRFMHPGLDFRYCAHDETRSAATENPPLVVPPPRASSSSSSSVISRNVGDPTITGLTGQMFRFVGRSGAWYSAVSAPSFQWNMKIGKFEGCSEDSNTFITGMGLTIFGDGGTNIVKHRFEVSIVNPEVVYTGCGESESKEDDLGCLGSGSLELILDGHKVVRSIDVSLDEDPTTRVMAYNTISKCSRRWFDLDEDAGALVTQATIDDDKEENIGTPSGGIFDMIEENILQETMVEREGCQIWLEERRTANDILRHTGRWSTVVIRTDVVSFHIEYRQQEIMDSCNAHNLDVWMTKKTFGDEGENWEGIIGETKSESESSTTIAGKEEEQWEKIFMNRDDVLKYENDDDYEVLSSFSTNCHACVDRPHQTTATTPEAGPSQDSGLNP